jgi:hypothetical protein
MLTEREQKLLRLALDAAAAPGEVTNAATMLIHSVRKRLGTVDEFTQPVVERLPVPSRPASATTYCEDVRMTFGKYRDWPLKRIDSSYLIWVLRNCVRMNPSLRLAIAEYLDLMR